MYPTCLHEVFARVTQEILYATLCVSKIFQLAYQLEIKNKDICGKKMTFLNWVWQKEENKPR